MQAGRDGYSAWENHAKCTTTKISWKFPALFNRVCAMTNSFFHFWETAYEMRMPTLQHFFWTIYSPLTRVLSLFQHYLRKGKRSILALVQKFGEIYITTHCNNSRQAKLANCCIPGIWMCFTKGHPGSTYHVLNPKAKSSLTKDVTFLG